MSQPERFEILVVGSGAGGKLLAWHMAGATFYRRLLSQYQVHAQ